MDSALLSVTRSFFEDKEGRRLAKFSGLLVQLTLPFDCFKNEFAQVIQPPPGRRWYRPSPT